MEPCDLLKQLRDNYSSWESEFGEKTKELTVVECDEEFGPKELFFGLIFEQILFYLISFLFVLISLFGVIACYKNICSKKKD